MTTDAGPDICERCSTAHWYFDDCTVDGRAIVRCDDTNCRAFDQPQTCDEMEDALEHWRCHSWLHGCSHGQ